jgi:hypothetical protein
VLAAPQHERPVCSMPQPSQQHGEPQIAIGLPLAFAAATQWNVEIIAQTGGERNVPAPPEVRDIRGLVRGIEILRKAKAEHQAQPTAMSL